MMSPSYNHSYLAYQIAKLLDQEEKFNFHIEMTLDINGADYILDIAVYGKKPIDFHKAALARCFSRATAEARGTNHRLQAQCLPAD